VTTAKQHDYPALYEKTIAQARKVLAGVKPDQWSNATPCTDWTVRQLVNHMVSGITRVKYAMNNEQSPIQPGQDVLGDNPLASFDKASKEAIATFKAPGAMEKTALGFRGPQPGSAYAYGQFNDILIHTWDLAKATGQNTTLDKQLVEADYEIAAPQGERWASPAFGGADKPSIGASADTQAKLLALMGRKA